jgi:hypothetical protein
VIVPASDRFIVCSQAALIDPDVDGFHAWAERHVRKDPDLRWIVGNYVEADEPNGNGHVFPLAELQQAKATLVGKPLNMLHREHYIVGAFAGAELLHANGMTYDDSEQDCAAAEAEHPYIEALAGMWHDRFPEEFFQIRRAHHEGSLFFSMEARPEKVSCPTCSHLAVFAGFESDTYCAHMQGAVGPKILHNPVFNGGAIIIPPLKPGWNRADVTAISQLLEPVAEAVYAQVTEQAPHLAPDQWEAIMAQLVQTASEPMPAIVLSNVTTTANTNADVSWLPARDVSTKERNKLAETNKAMPDGSFPIANENDLKNAIKAIGRAKDPAAAKSHITRRAKALGRTDLLPPNW